MVYVFIFLFIFSIFCTFKSFMSKYSIFFLIIIWSLIGLLYTTLLRVAMNGNYAAFDWFNNMDTAFFMSLIKGKVSFFTLIRLFNIFTALYVFTTIIFIQVYTPKLTGSVKKTVFTYGLIFLVALSYIIFYDPATTYRFYRLVVENGHSFFIIQCIDFGFYICIYSAMILPIVFLLKKYRILTSVYEKKRLIGVGAFVILSEILWSMLYKINFIRSPYFTQPTSNIIVPYSSSVDYNNTYTITILLLIVCMFFIIINFNVIRQDGLIHRLIIRKQTQTMNENFQKTFHSVKNVIFSHKLLLNRAQQAEGEERDALLNTLNEKIDNYLNHLSLMFASDSTLGDFSEELVYVSDILDDTIDRLDIPSGITLNRDYAQKAEEIYADSFYLNDALLNIFHNAVQAIEATERGGGEITVSASYEFEWLLISIADNGVGMTRKEQKSIFTPFFTTKSRINNWGVGLAFTASIIKYHKGKISFKSKKNHGTTFYILLPAKKR